MIRMTTYRIVCVIVAATTLSTSVNAQNLLMNGGAEAGDTQPWVVTKGPISASRSQDQGSGTVRPQQGEFFFNSHNQSGSCTSMRQTGTSGLVSGLPLILSGFVQTESTTSFPDYGEAVLRVFGQQGELLDEATSGLLASSVNGTWEAFDVSLIVPANATSWEVELLGNLRHGGAVNVYFDGLVLDANPCLTGNVNRGVGDAVDVLRINGQTGTVVVGAGQPITIDLSAAPEGGEDYVLWIWSGDGTSPLLLDVGTSVLGCVANPTPVHPFGMPAPALCLRSDRSQLAIFCHGTRTLPSPASVPWSQTRERGFDGNARFVLQALLEDHGSLSLDRFSLTNTVTLLVE